MAVEWAVHDVHIQVHLEVRGTIVCTSGVTAIFNDFLTH